MVDKQKDNFMLGNLDIYKLSGNFSIESWKIYNDFHWQTKKIIGDQFIRSADSVGANIAEGYGRFHYKDKVRFYYNSRGSLLEAKHWIFLLYQREFISKDIYNDLIELSDNLHKKLNGFIRHCKLNS